jgi:hypothetical protein
MKTKNTMPGLATDVRGIFRGKGALLGFLGTRRCIMDSERMKTEWRQFQTKVLENWDRLTLEGNPMITGKWDLFPKSVPKESFQEDRAESKFERVPTQPETDDWITWRGNNNLIPNW